MASRWYINVFADRGRVVKTSSLAACLFFWLAYRTGWMRSTPALGRIHTLQIGRR